MSSFVPAGILLIPFSSGFHLKQASAEVRGSVLSSASLRPLPAQTAHLGVGLLFLFFKPKPNKYAIY